MSKRNSFQAFADAVRILSKMSEDQMAEAFVTYEKQHGEPFPRGAEFLAIARAEDARRSAIGATGTPGTPGTGDA